MYIGIDAGGTKTDICICSPDGHVARRASFGGINAARMGTDAAAQRIAGCLTDIGFTRAQSLYAGIAGAGDTSISAAIKASLHALLPDIQNITVASDAFNGLNTIVGAGDGIALIAGTGSSAFVRIDGKATQVGGRGYLIDDAGSGFWTGKSCLNAAYRAMDGRGKPTLIMQKVEEHLGMPLARAIPVIYEKGVSYIASFAPIAFECAAAGDPVASEIAEACVRELWLHVRACLDACLTPPRICVATGGMLRAPYLRERLSVHAESAGLKMVFPTLPPVAGAVIAAAGNSADGAFIKTLKDDIDGLQ